MPRTSVGPCPCGAPAGPLGHCVDYYHAILAAEHVDPGMGRWHTVVVCAYLLQHPGDTAPEHLDVQFRMLQFHLDNGLEALLRLARHQVARNSHRARTGYDLTPLATYLPLPRGGPPRRFPESFSALPVRDESFTFDGHEAYGQRIDALARATAGAWRSLAT